MNHDLFISESVLIHASPERIWEVLTNPKLIAEYLYGTETITDWKKGCEIIFQGEYEGTKYRDKGVILEIIPNREIRYSYWSSFMGIEDKPENYGVLTYTIEPKGKEAVFTWHQRGFVDESRLQHSKDGLPALLNQVREIAERE
jgi:uncharacterized protein YndB with AHSA1/START domain